MSPDSQRLEIECLQSKLAQWRTEQPDFHDRILSLVSVWLHPAMDTLNMSELQLKRAIESAPDGDSLLMWLAEEALGYPYNGTTLFDRYIQDSGRSDNGLYLRFLRRLTNSTTTLWKITKIADSRSFIIEPTSGSGPSHTVHDRLLTQSVSENDVLMTRLIDMPAGPILGQAVFNLGPLDAPTVEMSPGRVQHMLSALAGIFLNTSPIPENTGASDHGVRHPLGGQEPHNSQNNNNPPHKEDAPGSQDSAERERLLERVRKLFAMAQQSEASPHEAEIALRRCQSLMSKYGISEADLHTSEFGHAEFTKGRTIPSHVKFLASAVAKLHDVLFVRGDAGFAEFRGFDVDAKVARMTLEYLIDAVERALANRKRAGDFPAGRSAAYDYRLGFATQVNKRVREIVKERKAAEQAATGTGTSLTVRKMEIVDRECGHDLRNASFSSSRGARNGAAHAAGVDDGSNVSLDQQVGGSAAPLALPKQ